MPANPTKLAPPPWRSILALVAAAALWSLNGPLIKLVSAGDDGAPAITIACYRSLIGAVIFLPFALRKIGTLRNVSPAWPIGCVLAFTLMTSCFVIATTQTAAANAIILQYTSPIWVVLLAPLLLGERTSLREAAVLLLAMVGVAIIFFGGETSQTTGLVVALISGVGYGTLTVCFRGLRRVDATVTVSLNMLGSGLLLIPAVVIWGSFVIDAQQFLGILMLGIVQFSLPYLLFAWALKHIEAHRAALIVLLETILNPLWTWLIVHESVPPATLLGGPLILISVAAWMVMTARKPSEPRAQASG